MSTIINKSNHPVEVKKINIQIWKFRDEIEKAIAVRLEQSGGDSNNLDIEDIRSFYSRKKPNYLDPNFDPEDKDDDNIIPIGADGTDSSGNEMDDDALAMMEALKGGDEEETKSESEAEPQEDDEAAKLAAEMLGDQGGGEDEAAKLAAEMLGDQAGGEDEAAKLAAEMLGDQGGSEDEVSTTKKELTRVHPDQEKMSNGFTLLSDINMQNIVFFSKHGYTYGQNISIELLIPNHFIISAEVKACINMTRTSKIISESKPNFRIEADITYLWDGERTNLRDFLKSVEPVIPPSPKKMKRPETDDDDDDEFEDLGF